MKVKSQEITQAMPQADAQLRTHARNRVAAINILAVPIHLYNYGVIG